VLFVCTAADLVGKLNGNGQKKMLQIDAPPVENFWLRHCMFVHNGEEYATRKGVYSKLLASSSL